MSTKQLAGSKARTDGDAAISDNSSGCAVCGAHPTGVRAAAGETVPVCEAHARPDPSADDTVRYVSQGMICAGRVIERSGDILAVNGIAEEQITVGQVLTIVTRSGGA